MRAFYNVRRANCADAVPNPAHGALVTFAGSSHEVVLITQNMDNLRERAGSQNVIHMHGELMHDSCIACNHRWDAPLEMRVSDACPRCDAATTQPDIVWFGEIPYHMKVIEQHLISCDLFVAIGTSIAVYPAAGFMQLADASGADTLELNLAPPDVQ